MNTPVLERVPQDAIRAVFPDPMPAFSTPRHVQGADVSAAPPFLRIVSGGRYKRFPQGAEYVYSVNATGHIKWARGEAPVQPGACYFADGLEEYELNGAGEFFVAERAE